MVNTPGDLAMPDPPPLRVRFGDYELDEARNELRGGDADP